MSSTCSHLYAPSTSYPCDHQRLCGLITDDMVPTRLFYVDFMTNLTSCLATPLHFLAVSPCGVMPMAAELCLWRARYPPFQPFDERSPNRRSHSLMAIIAYDRIREF